MPCETAVEGDGGRWWSDVDEVGMLVGLRVHQREAGEGAGGQKPNPSCRSSDLANAMRGAYAFDRGDHIGVG